MAWNENGDEMEVVEANPKDLVGAKKPDLSLVPPVSTLYEALALQNGAEKYGPYNWREKKVQARTYVAACMRHLASWLDGEENAEDSGINHLAHAKACLAVLIDAKETGNLLDNRPKAGNVAEAIKRHTKQ